ARPRRVRDVQEAPRGPARPADHPHDGVRLGPVALDRQGPPGGAPDRPVQALPRRPAPGGRRAGVAPPRPRVRREPRRGRPPPPPVMPPRPRPPPSPPRTAMAPDAPPPRETPVHDVGPALPRAAGPRPPCALYPGRQRGPRVRPPRAGDEPGEARLPRRVR